jgi:hypothetical protein
MPPCRSSAPALPSINCPALRTVELSATRPAGRTVYRYKWLGRPTTSNLQFCINWARPERRHLEPDAVELFLCSVSAYLRATHRVITLALAVAVLPFAGFAQQSLPGPQPRLTVFPRRSCRRLGRSGAGRTTCLPAFPDCSTSLLRVKGKLPVSLPVWLEYLSVCFRHKAA